MTQFLRFLRDLLNEGTVELLDWPECTDLDRPAALECLEEAYDTHALSVAGPPIPFDQTVALTMAQLVADGCWLVLSHAEPPEMVQAALRITAKPLSPSHILSGDLMLRYLAGIYKRAWAMDPKDVLTIGLSDILRAWPLSGVLADISEPPTTDLDFFGHRGLQILYAERFATNERSSWLPSSETGREVFEWVYAGLKRPLPPILGPLGVQG